MSSTIAPVFVDTNVLVYARDAGHPAKQSVAAQWMEELWLDQRGRTSMQVLCEYYVVTTRKLPRRLSPSAAWDDVEALLSWRPLVTDVELLRRARDVERRFKLSWWDSLIVAAAQLQGCVRLLTEDLQDGADFGVVVANPFVDSVREERADYRTSRRFRSRGRPKR